jgi:2-polyprenyl-3-methyl-5-hydroxy-6-metoxy-1,4-benzoquinol methylase
MTRPETKYAPDGDELLEVFRQKYSRKPKLGWGPKMRLDFGYFTPDDHYEALVGRLLAPGMDWCDVGCGRNIFPENPQLAQRYASRCGYVYGIDPDDNVQDNRFVHAYHQGLVEDCPIDRRFDLVTLRMVAEHIAQPTPALRRIATLLKPSGHAVIYTPHKWAPMSVAAAITPFMLHNPLKRLLWSTEARDTFPTQYKLNTRGDIERHAAAAGLALVHYTRLDDCRITNSYRLLNRLELCMQRAMSSVGLPYPEACILAVVKHRG